MSTVATRNGIGIFYKDLDQGQPIVCSHGWPLSADDRDAQMLFVLRHGYRGIAHDRRGHGRAAQIDAVLSANDQRTCPEWAELAR